MTVFSSWPMALSWSTTRPISRSMRSIIAAWIAIFAAWKSRSSPDNSFHGAARPTSPLPIRFLNSFSERFQ